MTATATSAPSRVVQLPIGGIKLIHELHLPLRFTAVAATPWGGSRDVDAPITVRHLVGSDDVSGFSETLDTPPWQTFYRDDAGETAIRFHRINERIPPATLRTVREGEYYEMRYAEVPSGDVDHRGRDLMILTIALPARRRGVLVHSCGIRLPNGNIVLCPGVSGRGKSTLARLVQRSRTGATLLSDDRCIVTWDDSEIRVWGTPWPGDANVAEALDGRLAAILLIGRSTETKLVAATPAQVAHVLLETVVLPLWQAELLATTLGIVDRLSESVPGYFFDYPTVPAATDWLIERLQDELKLHQ